MSQDAKDRICSKLGDDGLQWPTEAKLPSAFFVELLRYLACKHGGVTDGSVAWVKRVSSWVQSERGKARKKQKRSIEFVESEFDSGTEIEVQEEDGSWEPVVMYIPLGVCEASFGCKCSEMSEMAGMAMFGQNMTQEYIPHT